MTTTTTLTTKERQVIEVAKLEAELNALKVDAKKVRRGVFDVSIWDFEFYYVFEISRERERSRIVIVVYVVVFVSSDGLLRVFFCRFLLAFDRRLRRRRAFGVVLVATLYWNE